MRKIDYVYNVQTGSWLYRIEFANLYFISIKKKKQVNWLFELIKVVSFVVYDLKKKNIDLPNEVSWSERSDRLGTFCIFLGPSSGSCLSRIGWPPSKLCRNKKGIEHLINKNKF